ERRMILAGFPEIAGALDGVRDLEGTEEDLALAPVPLLLVFLVQRYRLRISRRSHARPCAQSRLIVDTETPSTADASSAVSPPIATSSTTFAWRSSRRARSCKASSIARAS